MKLTPIKIRKSLLFDAKKIARVIDNTLDGAAKDVKVDFDVTTQTWNHRPEFTIEKKPGERIVSTTDEVYGYVEGGTRPHVIVARAGKVLRFGANYQAKTTPRVIASRSGGSSGATIYRPRVNHPGTEARNFAETIREKWDDELPAIMQRAIDSEL